MNGLAELSHLVRTHRFRAALEYYYQHPDTGWRARPECQLLAGDAAARLGELPQSLTLLTAAQDGFLAAGNVGRAGEASNLLGAIAFERGRISEAQQHFCRAERIASEVNDRLLTARAGNNLGIVLDLLDRPEAALARFQSSIQAFTYLDNSRGIAESSHNQGVLYRRLGRWSEAAEAVSLARREAERAGMAGLVALCMLGQAELALAGGQPDLASSLIVRSAGLAAAGEDRLNGLEAGRLRALVAFRRGEWAIAHHLAEIAASLAAGLGSVLLKLECLGISAMALLRLGRLREAQERRDEVTCGYRSLGSTRMLENFELQWAAG